MAYNQSYGGNSYGQKQDLSVTPVAVEIKSFYEADGKTIQNDLFDKTAEKVAKSFVGKDRKGFDVGVSSTQLRRLFDEVKRFEQILLIGSGQWEKQLPYIKMIKSKVAYSVARAGEKKESEKGVYKNLGTFISSAIDLIKTEEDYHLFVSLFEASYGFYYEIVK